MGKAFMIASGKGGVGKSTLAAALAVTFARQDVSCILIDADAGLRCADLLLDLQDHVVFDLQDLASGECTADQALVQHPLYPSLWLLAAPQLVKASDMRAKEIRRAVELLKQQADVVLLDCPAGLGRNLKNVLGSADQTLLVATPDDVSVRDIQRMDYLLGERGEARPGLILNRVSKKLIHLSEMQPPHIIAESLDLPLLGVLPESQAIYRALLQRKTAADCADAAVRNALQNIAMRMLGAQIPLPHYRKSAVRSFFSRGGISI